MDEKHVKDIKYAIEMLEHSSSVYRILAKVAPALLLLAVVVVGIITGKWWQVALYVLVLVFYFPKWKKEIRNSDEVIKELTEYLENGGELSETAEAELSKNMPSSKALWLGIISLGIIVVMCIVFGINIINLAYYEVFDAPTLGVGIFFLCIGMIVAVPVMKWCLQLPKAKKVDAE